MSRKINTYLFFLQKSDKDLVERAPEFMLPPHNIRSIAVDNAEPGSRDLQNIPNIKSRNKPTEVLKFECDIHQVTENSISPGGNCDNDIDSDVVSLSTISTRTSDQRMR